jgi:hypothetical protein
MSGESEYKLFFPWSQKETNKTEKTEKEHIFWGDSFLYKLLLNIISWLTK